MTLRTPQQSRGDFSCVSLTCPDYGRFYLYDIRETIQKTGAADVLAGDAGCNRILASS